LFNSLASQRIRLFRCRHSSHKLDDIGAIQSVTLQLRNQVILENQTEGAVQAKPRSTSNLSCDSSSKISR
jgi:hypothetical protein